MIHVRERLKSSLRKFYGWYGDLIKQYETPSPESYTAFYRMTKYSDTLHWSDTNSDLDLISEFEILPNCSRFP